MRYKVHIDFNEIEVVADSFEYVSEDGYMYFFLGEGCVGAYRNPVSVTRMKDLEG